MPGFTQSNATPVINGLTLIEDIVSALQNGGAQQWFTSIGNKLTTPAQDRWLLESNTPLDSYLTTNPNQKYRLLVTAVKAGTNISSVS